MNPRELLAIAGAGALLAASAAAGPRLETLVSTGWLAGHLNDRNVAVLHVARERAHYDAGHIPGACFVPWSELMVTRDGVTNELPPVADLERLFERCGVSDNSRVVLYGDTLVLSATRAWFTLDYLGHGGHAALLDGGLEKWRAEQRPLSKEEPTARQGRLTPRIRTDAVVGLEQMREFSRAAVSAPTSKVVIIDTRSPADFRKGHIPGAVNVFWPETIVSREMPMLRPLPEVEHIYQAAGVVHGRTIVVYCMVGVQASHAYFTLKHLGYDVRLYDGSFSEWSRAKDAPVQ